MLAERAEKAATGRQTRILYQTAKNLTGKFRKTEAPVNDVNGRTVFGREAQANMWTEHFVNLPNNPPSILPARSDLPIIATAHRKRKLLMR